MKKQVINLPIPKNGERSKIELKIGGYKIATIGISSHKYTDPEIGVYANIHPKYYPKECPRLRFDDLMVVCGEMKKTQLKDGNIWTLEHVGAENGELVK